MKLIFSSLLMVCCSFVSAQDIHRSWDKMLKNYDKMINSQQAQLKAKQAYDIENYNAYLQQANREYNHYLDKINSIWMDKEYVGDTRTVWVEYSDDMTDRSIVDFETGEVEIGIVVDADAEPEEINEKLASAIDRALTSRGTTCPYDSEVEEKENLTETPILQGLIDLAPFKEKPEPPVVFEEPEETLSEQETHEVAKVIADESEKIVETKVKPDGGIQKNVSIKLNLNSNALSRSAALYKDIVADCSRRFSIEEPMIFAIIECESSFNPRARSAAHAYGLMQIIPRAAGRDAYRYVNHRNWTPSMSYLFNPKHNIELGTAYLRILTNQFDKVQDHDCRRLCVIASYNTGSGNVSRAFTGNTNVKSAITRINEHDYNSLYRFLTTRLSSREARNYVSNVTSNMQKYTD